MLCNEVDIPDGTWTFDVECIFRLVGPLDVAAATAAEFDAVDDSDDDDGGPAVAPKCPCNWTLFNDDDIRLVVELAWLIAGDVLDDDDAAKLLVDAVNAMEDECSDAAAAAVAAVVGADGVAIADATVECCWWWCVWLWLLELTLFDGCCCVELAVTWPGCGAGRLC